MGLLDDFAKNMIGNSEIAQGAAKPEAAIRLALQETAKTVAAWQAALSAIEAYLAGLGIKIEAPK